jgi:hypothetical protein
MYIVCQLKNVTIYSGKNDVGLQRRINVNFKEMTNFGLNIKKNQGGSGYSKEELHCFRKTGRKITTGNIVETAVLPDLDPEQSDHIRAGIFPL